MLTAISLLSKVVQKCILKDPCLSMHVLFLKSKQILAMSWPRHSMPCGGISQEQTRQPCLSVWSHRACRQGLVKHLHIWMLGKVVQPTKVTNEFLQLLQKLGKTNHKEEGIQSQINQCSYTATPHGRNTIKGRLSLIKPNLYLYGPISHICHKGL